jgi:hypothetical protein
MTFPVAPLAPTACPWCQPYLASNNVCALHYDRYELRWKPRGFTFEQHLTWSAYVEEADNAAVYRDAGLRPDDARQWAVITQLPADTLVPWHATGLNPHDVLAWLAVRTVTSVADYQALASAGLTPLAAQRMCGTKPPFRLGRHLRGSQPDRVTA